MDCTRLTGSAAPRLKLPVKLTVAPLMLRMPMVPSWCETNATVPSGRAVTLRGPVPGVATVVPVSVRVQPAPSVRTWITLPTWSAVRTMLLGLLGMNSTAWLCTVGSDDTTTRFTTSTEATAPGRPSETSKQAPSGENTMSSAKSAGEVKVTEAPETTGGLTVKSRKSIRLVLKLLTAARVCAGLRATPVASAAGDEGSVTEPTTVKPWSRTVTAPLVRSATNRLICAGRDATIIRHATATRNARTKVRVSIVVTSLRDSTAEEEHQSGAAPHRPSRLRYRYRARVVPDGEGELHRARRFSSPPSAGRLGRSPVVATSCWV